MSKRKPHKIKIDTQEKVNLVGTQVAQPQSPRVEKALYLDFLETEVKNLRRQELDLECDLARVRGYLQAASMKLQSALIQ